MWKRLAALEGWQRASLIGAAIGPTWFAFERLPGYLDGTRPTTLGALASDLAFMVGSYLATLWAWGSYYARYRLPNERADNKWDRAGLQLVSGFTGLQTTVEILPQSIRFLVSLPRKALRSLRRTGAPR